MTDSSQTHSFTKDDLMNDLISDKGLCRTAPDTPGLLKTSNIQTKYIHTDISTYQNAKKKDTHTYIQHTYKKKPTNNTRFRKNHPRGDLLKIARKRDIHTSIHAYIFIGIATYRTNQPMSQLVEFSYMKLTYNILTYMSVYRHCNL